ncbi:hypothetical protein FV228_00060 [Methylobacterium sp. WL18]|uniref:hypothetical protein n=1 Tax=Methylobacterium sp. WL18 TaxID=2603897 RepID=UPI0011C8C717|nr:hypothetical protein [Methylobacterium sp. WL18]TXN76583.1 hypothetical protein FV228_00060 [Methylobacterium sp. WL18]
MISKRVEPTEPMSPSEDALTDISQREFVAGWAALVGEPPVMMLENRSEMIRVLVESTPIVPLVASVPFTIGEQDEQN